MRNKGSRKSERERNKDLSIVVKARCVYNVIMFWVCTPKWGLNHISIGYLYSEAIQIDYLRGLLDARSTK